MHGALPAIWTRAWMANTKPASDDQGRGEANDPCCGDRSLDRHRRRLGMGDRRKRGPLRRNVDRRRRHDRRPPARNTDRRVGVAAPAPDARATRTLMQTTARRIGSTDIAGHAECLLAEAHRLVSSGWCQRDAAQDYAGNPLAPASRFARRWSPTGALQRLLERTSLDAAVAL